MTPKRLALVSLLTLLALVVLIAFRWRLDEEPAPHPRATRPRPAVTAAPRPPPPIVFAAWSEGEQSFVLLHHPADAATRTWRALPSGLRVARAPALATALELTLVNPAGWKHTTTAEQIVVDTSWLDNQHTGRSVAHPARQRATHPPTAAVAVAGFALDGHAREAPMGSGRHFRIAIVGHVRDAKWIDGVHGVSPVGPGDPQTPSQREAQAWATRVGQGFHSFTSDVRAGPLSAEIDALVSCNHDPCITYLRRRGQDWRQVTGRIYGILEVASRTYLVTIDADFGLQVIDLSS